MKTLDEYKIEVDIPQLKVLEQGSYSSILVKFVDDIKEFPFWSYLGDKMQEIAVRHYWLNEIIREIYITHYLMSEERMAEEYYSMDEKHLRQLAQTRMVCESVAQLTKELGICLYYLKFVKTAPQLPTKVGFRQAINALLNDTDIQADFFGYGTFFGQAELILSLNHVNSIFPSYYLMQRDPSPAHYVMASDNQFRKYDVSRLLNDYNSFFDTCFKNLELHSPAAIASSLAKWSK